MIGSLQQPCEQIPPTSHGLQAVGMLGFNRLGPSLLVALDFKQDDFLCKNCLCLILVCKLVPKLPLIHESSACIKRAPLVAGEERRAVRAKRRGRGRGG